MKFALEISYDDCTGCGVCTSVCPSKALEMGDKNIDRVNNKINGVTNKHLYPETIVKEKGLVQISDAGEIVKVCQEAIAENAKIVADYKSGKKSAIGALVGAVMKKSKGKANPQMVNKTLTELLNK